MNDWKWHGSCDLCGRYGQFVSQRIRTCRNPSGCTARQEAIEVFVVAERARLVVLVREERDRYLIREAEEQRLGRDDWAGRSARVHHVLTRLADDLEKGGEHDA